MTTENKEKMFMAYQELIRKFFVLNNIEEVVCTDEKEHFFDKITIDKKGQMKVHKYGLKDMTWSTLYFDFTCDYAVCLANMERDLYLQEREGKHSKFTFKFNKDYIKPTLISI